MGKIFSPIITSLILINLCYGQPTQEWVRLYPDTNIFTAAAYALALDDSGNIYITGYATNNSTWTSYCTIKYNSNGIQQWVVNFTGPLSVTFSKSITLDKFSNVYVTGYSNNGSTHFDYCTVKYNSSGVQQWVKYYNGPVNGQDEAMKVAIDNAGNIYVSGFTTQSGGGQAFTTVKYSEDGNELWNRTYPLTSSAIYTIDMKIDDSCYVYVTGDFGIGITVKYDSSGNQIWSAIYPYTETGIRSLALDKHKNVYITGYFIDRIAGGRYFITIKYSSAGIYLWSARYNPENTAYSAYGSSTILLDKNEYVYVSGAGTPNYNTTLSNFCTIKYSNDGYLLWVKKDTAKLSNIRPSMSIDNDNYLYITGSSPRPPSGASIITIKYDSSGSQIWRASYTNGISIPRDIKLDNNSNVLITGSLNNRMVTIKYSKLLDININYSKILTEYKLYQNYPNPFNPKTKIKFDISSNIKSTPGGQMANVKIVIYNILGEEIAIIVNKPLKPGSYEVEWNAADYPSGIYLYKLVVDSYGVTDTYSETRKMIIFK